jgi:uncharacterized membrane protein (UPF0182 family)
MQIPRWLQTVIVVGFVLWLVNQPLIAIAVDWMWFDAIGYLGIFQKSLIAKVGMWVGGLLLAILFLGVNITVAMREEAINVDRLSTLMSDLGLAPAQLQALIRGIVGIAVGLPALLFAGIAASQWLTCSRIWSGSHLARSSPSLAGTSGSTSLSCRCCRLALICCRCCCCRR